MNKKETDLVINHLEYIRKRVDDINGRVRDNEKSISWIKGICLLYTSDAADE